MSIFLVAIFLIGLVFYGFDIGSFPLISPDEPRYAETAREMIERADYITPYCNYVPRFHKPILFYWLEILSFKVFGLNEFAARLPSVIAGSGLGMLAFLLGSAHSFGFSAAVIALTSLSIVIVSKLSITDMVLCFFMSAALSFFYLGYEQRADSRQKFSFKDYQGSIWLPLSIAMMGLGMLTKGPVAVVLPVVIILLFLYTEGDLFSFIRKTWLDIAIGIVLFLIINLPWYLSVHMATDGAFSHEFFIGHNINRFTSVHTGHSADWWFYLPVLAIGFFPWSFFLIQAISNHSFKQRFNLDSEDARASKLIKFSLIWAGVIFCFFTISKTKLPTYILSLYLPLALIVARWWQIKFKTQRSGGYKNLDGLLGLVLMLLSVSSAVFLALTSFKTRLQEINTTGLFLPISLIGFILIAASLIAMTAILHRARIAFIFIAASSLLAYLIASVFILHPFANYRDGGAKALMQELSPETKLISFMTHPERFEFYGERFVAKLNKKKFIKEFKEIDSEKLFFAKSRYMQRVDKFLGKQEPSLEHSIIKSNKVYTYFSQQL